MQDNAHYITNTEASANAFTGPTLAGLLPILGGVALGLFVAGFLALARVDTESILWWGSAVALLGPFISALHWLGFFDGLAWLVRTIWGERIIEVDADTNQDGETSPEELDAAVQLFSEAGLIRFVREFVYRRRDWRWRTLTRYVTQTEYDVIVNDILVEVGVLSRQKKRTRPRALCAGADGQPISQAEAERRIRAYFARPRRKVWTLDIEGRRVVL